MVTPGSKGHPASSNPLVGRDVGPMNVFRRFLLNPENKIFYYLCRHDLLASAQRQLPEFGLP